MSNKEVKPYILNMLDTLETMHKYTPENRDEFMADPNAQDATLMRLQDIGEQLSRVRDQFPEFYEMYHDESWYKLIGLRNIISHGYREIDFEIVWDIIHDKLAAFEAHLQKIAEDLRINP
jgi:uncharacterized protein with HEPN domain